MEDGIVGEPKGVKRRFTAQVRQIADTFNSMFGVNFDPLQPEQITKSSVAGFIDILVKQHERNPVASINDPDAKFSATQVAIMVGRLDIDQDIKSAYPAQYGVVRDQMEELVRSGILEKVLLPEPDSRGENLYYKVVDEQRLREAMTEKDVNVE